MIMAIAMQKGGVGKTTTAINLAAGLALADYRTLLVDLDPQANATSGLGINADDLQSSIYDFLFNDVPFPQTVQSTEVRDLDLLPGSIDMNGARAELPRQNSHFQELKSRLPEYTDKYDRVIIDCPPSLGPLTLNALICAQNVLIPLQCEYYALEGLSQLQETINRVKNNLNNKLYTAGIVLTMDDRRTNLARDVKQEVKNYFGDLVFKTTIPRNVRISEAPGYGCPVYSHAPTSAGSCSYLKFTEEVICNE
ncbi:MAG: ParA family protein [bacterium]